MKPTERPGAPARWYGLIAGVLAGAVAIGAGQLAAGLISPSSSPIAEVGQLQIDLTPSWLKNFAIQEFGSNDKRVLVTGIVIVLGLFAAVIGVLALLRIGYGFAGLAVFTAFGVIAATTRPTFATKDLMPTLLAAAAGAFALWLLVRTARREAPAPSESVAESAPAAGSAPAERPLPRTAESAPAEPSAPPPAEPSEPQPAEPSEPLPAEPAEQPASLSRSFPTLDRRRFLVVGAGAVGFTALSVSGGSALANRVSVAGARSGVVLPRPAQAATPVPPGADLHIPGLDPFVTPNSAFYRVDTTIVLPQIDPKHWRLRIHGMVDRETVVSFDDLLRQPLIEDHITLCCVSNPVGGSYIGNARWLGASLAGILRGAGIQAGADQLLCTSSDGFTSSTPVQVVMDGRDALLAVGMNGEPLPVAHGFPARMIVPGLYGYVSATKWVTDIKVTTYAADSAYWTQRGWSPHGPIKTESRIDVPRDGGSIRPGPTTVAGVAWAQHKGVAAVEVSVDSGPWQPARLADVPGLDTWRQWTWEWNATPGPHTLRARTTDATGYTQTADLAPSEPDGATGYPTTVVNVRSG